MQVENKDKLEKLAAFARRLQVLAGRHRLQQVSIAKILSRPGQRVSPQRVGSWFQGRNFPGGDIEHALASLLGTTRDWLIEGKENTDKPDSLVEEPIAPSRRLSSTEVSIRRDIDDLLRAASGSPERLGWIREQMLLYLQRPRHWTSQEEGDAKLEELRRSISIRGTPAESRPSDHDLAMLDAITADRQSETTQPKSPQSRESKTHGGAGR